MNFSAMPSTRSARMKIALLPGAGGHGRRRRLRVVGKQRRDEPRCRRQRRSGRLLRGLGRLRRGRQRSQHCRKGDRHASQARVHPRDFLPAFRGGDARIPHSSLCRAPPAPAVSVRAGRPAPWPRFRLPTRSADDLHTVCRRRPPRRACRVDGAGARHLRTGARAGVGRCELSPLFPGRATDTVARTRDADRDGRSAADGGLPPVRAHREAADGRRRARAASARGRFRARLPSPHRPWHAHLPRRARRRLRAAAVLRRDRRPDPLADRDARRRPAAVRRGAAHAGARALPGLVRGTAPGPDTDPRAGGDARRRHSG